MRFLHFLPSRKQLAAALVAALAVGGLARAAENGGVLGQRFVEVGLTTVDYSWLGANANATNVGVKLPVGGNLDLGFGYSFAWFDQAGVRVREHALTSSLLWHAAGKGVKPFAGFGLGYDYQRTTFRGGGRHEGIGLWGLTVGVEIPVGDLTLTPTASYNDTTARHSVGSMQYGVEANYWFTTVVAGYAEATYSHYMGDRGSAWTYRAGLRFRF